MRSTSAGVLGALTQPALFVTGGLDRIIPWQQTERAAREAPNGSFVLYEQGTHVCSNIPTGTARSWLTGWGSAERFARLNHLGEPVRRREDVRILQGQARYLDDLELPWMAHAAFVRSPHARADIISVTAPAQAPGLLGVLSAIDIAPRAQPFAVPPIEDALLSGASHPILADTEVRYAGQPVAAVIAESRAQAEDAAELVEVEYEPLDAVVDPRGAPEQLMRWRRVAGDVDGAFAGAAHVVRGRYALPRLVATPMETRGVIAAYDERDDLLTVWGSFQDPHRPRAQLAHALDRAPTGSGWWCPTSAARSAARA